ncbi:hypothetical protein NNJEOMEG_00582 [Fundidesulfovibrio magnetotacticus]|uniref:PDZ domain-containing protein n=1 Tax=Fundidesulfovibrio magnetotacticus TaxID=2730080 RepID=A0A6V8LWU7_9BACT|nr:ChaN family lipoprotein [Fundidesulfovibrio magnetotacticus]GFK92755.1 hypothetical protein NNJEOMEG_00582 [Fundidesulfovibrio magnetotacticus]
MGLTPRPSLQAATPPPGRRGPARSLLAALAVACLLSAAPGCKQRPPDVDPAPEQSQAQPVQPGQFASASGEALDPAWLAAQAVCSAYVLLGESHASACDHQAQARIIELMALAGTPPVVGLEMVSLDRQIVLDRFNYGLIGVDELEAELEWDKTWGFPFAAYRPIFEVAQAMKLPLFALNAPRETARKVGRTGLKSLSIMERLGLPARLVPPPPEQLKSLQEVFEAHQPRKGASQKALWKSFVDVQSLWDTTMARRAVEARVAWRRPVAVVAGGGHVEYGWGIASRLAAFDPEGQRLLVMPWRGGETPDPAMANAFYYCPEPKRPRLGILLETREGVPRVERVEEGSRAQAAGVLPGDVLSRAGERPLKDIKDLHEAGIEAMRRGDPLRLEVLREGRAVEIVVPLPQAKTDS